MPRLSPLRAAHAKQGNTLLTLHLHAASVMPAHTVHQVLACVSNARLARRPTHSVRLERRSARHVRQASTQTRRQWHVRNAARVATVEDSRRLATSVLQARTRTRLTSLEPPHASHAKPANTHQHRLGRAPLVRLDRPPTRSLQKEA